ncbi:MAG: hypothetical protein JXK07_13330 [Spirochaetes bacterium]|nr:hypothetical protein [Spirochaetota bacterium]
MRNRFSVLIVLMFTQCAYSAGSKLMNYIGNFIPSLTEVGILTNCVNVYDKVSNFVRSTNKLVHSVQQAKSDWDRVRNNIEQIYDDVKYLKEINPYNMDTWQSGLNNFSFSLKHHQTEAINAFEMLEAHTLGASVNYLDNITTIIDFKKEFEHKKNSIKSLYVHPSYEIELSGSAESILKYRKATIGHLRSLQSADLLIAQTSPDQSVREEAKAHFDQLDVEIKSLEATSLDKMQLEKPDSIIDQASNLIAINLTEIKVCNQRIEDMIKASENFVAAYYRLLGQNVNSLKTNSTITLPQIPIDPTNYDPNNPDKVAVPQAPTIAPMETEITKKNISNHDIISLHNGVSFLALKQESLKRDLIAMKVNTMAFIVAMESYRRNNIEVSSLAFAHSFRMIEIAIEDLKSN